MDKPFKFEKKKVFSCQNRENIKAGAKGLFSDDWRELEEKIKTGNFEPEEIRELVEVDWQRSSTLCFCCFDTEEMEKTWYLYFYQIENKNDLVQSAPEGYAEAGGICCGTCKYGKWGGFEGECFFCHKDYREGVVVEESGMCFSYKKEEEQC